MASTINDPSKSSETKTNSLKDELNAALTSGFNCSIRYVHSPPKPCDPLFSALPGQEPEKTRLASHFLTVSIDPASLPHLGDVPLKTEAKDVISFAIEVLVFTTRRLTTIFVSKVDSTPFVSRQKPSPTKTAVTTFLRWLADEERSKRPSRKIVISLFARAQPQYLFPGSSDDKTKHVLDDRQLIKWWARVLDPIVPKNKSECSGEEAEVQYQGYMTVPGYSKHELRSFMPPSNPPADARPSWLPGNPLEELARTRGVPEHAPPRCLLPRFPDDPKARFMQDLDEEIGISQGSQVTVSPSKRKSGKWNSVRDLDRFWEAMEFRQECSSGRVVGFLWLVISPKQNDVEMLEADDTTAMNVDSQESSISLGAPPSSDLLPSQQNSSAPINGSPKKRKRKPFTGPIIPRAPRLKGGSSSRSKLTETQSHLKTQTGDGLVVTKEGYDKLMHTLLNLDFSHLQTAARSTTKWVAEVISIAGLNSDFAVAVSGKAEAPPTAAATNSSSAVNDLGGIIRKKRKAVDSVVSEGHAVAETYEGTARVEARVINVLGSGMIRKKPEPATT